MTKLIVIGGPTLEELYDHMQLKRTTSNPRPDLKFIVKTGSIVTVRLDAVLKLRAAKGDHHRLSGKVIHQQQPFKVVEQWSRPNKAAALLYDTTTRRGVFEQFR